MDQRQARIPIKASHSIKNGRRHYKDGVLLEWHKRCERIINGHSMKAKQAIEDGATARLEGVLPSSNPYSYKSELRNYCAWAAGWHDEK